MVEAGTLRRHCSRCGPGGCPHPIAVANASNIEKLSAGDAETFAPDSMMPARNGGTTSGSLRAMAKVTDQDPADCPCNTKVSDEAQLLRTIRTMSVTMLLSPPN